MFPNLRFVRGTMKSPHLKVRNEGLPATSAARVNRSLRYLGECLVNDRHSLNLILDFCVIAISADIAEWVSRGRVGVHSSRTCRAASMKFVSSLL